MHRIPVLVVDGSSVVRAARLCMDEAEAVHWLRYCAPKMPQNVAKKVLRGQLMISYHERERAFYIYEPEPLNKRGCWVWDENFDFGADEDD